MDLFEKNYCTKEDLPLLLKSLDAFNLESALNNAMDGFATPQYEMVQFILNHHPYEEMKKDFLLAAPVHLKLESYIRSQQASGVLRLNIEQLAGLVNANQKCII